VRIERFEDIEAWQMARALTNSIYAASRAAGFDRDFGLRDQIQRASGSIMHNIAEGFDAGSNAEFVRFLVYAQRSCTEVQSELYVALDQHYIPEALFVELYQAGAVIKAKIGAFIKYLRAHPRPSSLA